MPGSNPAVSGGSPRRRSGRSHEAPGDGRPRGMAVAAFERPIGRLGVVQNPAYAPSGAAGSLQGGRMAAAMETNRSGTVDD